ncbi:MAG: ABC transporter substrate-binding protein [Actinobacteria bacterium]|nr:ABC transporter substrate-binding protein [Actinomycetota bacterium]
MSAARFLWFKSAALVALAFLSSCSVQRDNQSPEPVTDAVLSVALTGIDSLDPARGTSYSSLMILRTACDGLTTIDSDGETRRALASGWRVSNAGSMVTFELEDGAEFLDGTLVTAQSVVESLSRITRPETSSPWASLLSDVEGFAEVAAGAATSLSGLRAPDTNTLEVVLTNPFADLPRLLAHPAFVPVSVGAEGTITCSGPYEIQEPAGPAGAEVVLERATGAAGGLLKTIHFKVTDTPDDAYRLFQEGQAGASVVPDAAVGEASSVRKGYLRAETPEITFLAMDVTKPPTDNERLRQAISLALDRLATIDATFGDQRPPAVRWIPGTEGDGGSCSDLIRRISDPERAKQLMSESGVDPSGVQLPFYFDQTKTGRLVVQAIEVQIADGLGLRLTPSPHDPPGMDASMTARTGAGVWMLSYGQELPLPGLVVDALFRTGSPANRLGFSDPAVDEALAAARRSADTEDRERAYLEAESLICQRMPAVPLWRGVRHWAYDPAKLGFEGSDGVDSAGGMVLRDARVP